MKINNNQNELREVASKTLKGGMTYKRNLHLKEGDVSGNLANLKGGCQQGTLVSYE